MSFLSDRVLDRGLSAITEEADTLHICTLMPYTFEDAVVLSVANKMPMLISPPFQSHIHSGRDVFVSEITDGTVTATGKGEYFALVDSVNGELLASGPLCEPIELNEGNLFTLNAFTIGIPTS